MKQRLSLLVLSGAILALAVLSCNKESAPPAETNATRIIGSWRQVYHAIDSNNNGRPDSAEQVRTTEYRVLSFFSNGNVHDTSFVDDTASSLNSTFAVNGDYLSIFARGVVPSRILQLDSGTLILKDSATRPALISAFTKIR